MEQQCPAGLAVSYRRARPAGVLICAPCHIDNRSAFVWFHRQPVVRMNGKHGLHVVLTCRTTSVIRRGLVRIDPRRRHAADYTNQVAYQILRSHALPYSFFIPWTAPGHTALACCCTRPNTLLCTGPAMVETVVSVADLHGVAVALAVVPTPTATAPLPLGIAVEPGHPADAADAVA
jgi:hypothetical protein